MGEFYIGLMSGTSVDAIDAALVEIKEGHLHTVATHSHPIPAPLQTLIHQLCQPGPDEIMQSGKASHLLGLELATATMNLLNKAGLSSDQINAIGSHGQTIRHQPSGETPFTLQIGNPSLVAALTGVVTVADFRSADIALKGEGAPLTPAFHQALFQHPEECRSVLNIGGIANITYLPKPGMGEPIGFDTGPGNTLLDGSCDHNGNWARSGSVNPALLQKLMAAPYLKLPPPKSTGRELFNLAWLDEQLDAFEGITSQDVQATLSQFTAESIASAIERHAAPTEQILLCGGGAHNRDLVRRLDNRLGQIRIQSTTEHGLDGDYVEAAAFAWLAFRRMHHIPTDLASITGATRPALLGATYRP